MENINTSPRNLPLSREAAPTFFQSIPKRILTKYAPLALLFASSLQVSADEQLLGKVKGAETMPAGAQEIIVQGLYRADKSAGNYEALNTQIEYEYGVSDRFSASAYLKFQSIDLSGLTVDGYLPKDEKYDFAPSGTELSGKYMFLSPAKDPIGLSTYFGMNYDWLDPHSGQDKDTLSLELMLILQKYFLDGQLVWLGNAGYETTFADRGELDDLPEDFEWPTDPEMEIELILSTGLSYRFAPNWYLGVEAIYETEFETEVGQERWSVFAGPSLHYGSARWWATFSWLPQIQGGGEMFDEQTDTDLHLIEKTEQEFVFKVGFNL